MSDAPDLSGSVIGNWRLLRMLGEGAFGAVYESENATVAGKRAAVKVLHSGMAMRADIKRRFINEASAASRAEHENIVQVYDGGLAADGTCYVVMELLRGSSLRDLLASGPLEPTRACRLTAQVALGLAAAHQINVVHRDLKPDNIFIVARGSGETAKVLDFGIAKLLDEASADARTRTGTVMGTPAYMSPEQWMAARDLDARSDLYSLGIVLFECLAGRPPFEGQMYELMNAHVNQAPPRLDQFAGVPPSLAELVSRLLLKSREERPASAAEVARALLAEVERFGQIGGQTPTVIAPPMLSPLPSAPSASISVARGELKPSPDPKRSLRPLVMLGATAIVLAAGTTVALVTREAHKTPEPAPPVKSTAAVEPAAISPEMVELGPGRFRLGWGDSSDRLDGPAHDVDVERFAIDRYEVSFADYRRFVEASHLQGELPWDGVEDFSTVARLPVNLVRQADAAHYCAWRGARLPSEVEWEFAARDGGSRLFPWGDKFDGARCNAARGARARLEPVDALPEGATPHGIFNLIGNVAEWTASPASLFPGARGVQPPIEQVVVRGGAAHSTARDELTATARAFVSATHRDSYIGFRCALTRSQ